MRIIILLSLIFYINVALAQDWLKETESLNGKVMQYSYESIAHGMKSSKKVMFNSNGFITKSTSNIDYRDFGTLRNYDKEDRLCLIEYSIQDNDTASIRKFEYDSLGRVTKGILYNWGKHWSTFNYIYNPKGLLQECFVEIKKDGDIHRQTFEYDMDGRLIKDLDVSKTHKEIKLLTYDDNGLLIAETLLDSNWASTTTYKMNNEGKVIDKKTVNNSKKAYTKDSHATTFSYNKKGQIIVKVRSNLEGNLISKFTYTYNKEGDEATMVEYNADKDKEWESTYTYEYDSYGNWTVKLTKFSGKTFKEERRKIKYF